MINVPKSRLLMLILYFSSIINLLGSLKSLKKTEKPEIEKDFVRAS